MTVPIKLQIDLERLVVHELTEDQRIDLIQHICENLIMRGSIDKVRERVNSPSLDD